MFMYDSIANRCIGIHLHNFQNEASAASRYGSSAVSPSHFPMIKHQRLARSRLMVYPALTKKIHQSTTGILGKGGMTAWDSWESWDSTQPWRLLKESA